MGSVCMQTITARYYYAVVLLAGDAREDRRSKS
jgi:hypothetical protein